MDKILPLLEKEGDNHRMEKIIVIPPKFFFVKPITDRTECSLELDAWSQQWCDHKMFIKTPQGEISLGNRTCMDKPYAPIEDVRIPLDLFTKKEQLMLFSIERVEVEEYRTLKIRCDAVSSLEVAKILATKNATEVHIEGFHGANHRIRHREETGEG